MTPDERHVDDRERAQGLAWLRHRLGLDSVEWATATPEQEWQDWLARAHYSYRGEEPAMVNTGRGDVPLTITITLQWAEREARRIMA